MRGGGNAQPIKLSIVCEFEDKFVDHAVDANRAAHKLQISIRRIVEDEVVMIEDRKTAPAYAASQLFNIVSEFLVKFKRPDSRWGHGSRMALAP